MKNQLNPLVLRIEGFLTNLSLLGKADYHEKRMRNNRIANNSMADKIQAKYNPSQLKALLIQSKNPKARFVANKLSDTMTPDQYRKVIVKYIMSPSNLDLISPMGLTRSRIRKWSLSKKDPNKFLSKNFKDKSLRDL